MNRCVDAGVQLRACIADAAAALMNVIATSLTNHDDNINA